MDSQQAEPVYFDNGDVQVTRTRLVSGDTTYPTANITSVSTTSTQQGGCGAGCLILVGIFAAYMAFQGVSAGNEEGGMPPAIQGMLGFLLIVMGGMWIRALKPMHHVSITTSAGEVQAYSSKDSEVVEGIVQAINQSLVDRG
jgi:hypothetical protein